MDAFTRVGLHCFASKRCPESTRWPLPTPNHGSEAVGNAEPLLQIPDTSQKRWQGKNCRHHQHRCLPIITVFLQQPNSRPCLQGKPARQAARPTHHSAFQTATSPKVGCRSHPCITRCTCTKQASPAAVSPSPGQTQPLTSTHRPLHTPKNNEGRTIHTPHSLAAAGHHLQEVRLPIRTTLDSQPWTRHHEQRFHPLPRSNTAPTGSPRAGTPSPALRLPTPTTFPLHPAKPGAAELPTPPHAERTCR